VGYDEESKTFDIDRISSRISTSQRNKVFIVRDAISELEKRMGKLIPIEEIEKELESKLKKDEMGDALLELKKNSVIFEPKKGYIQKMWFQNHYNYLITNAIFIITKKIIRKINLK